MSQHAPGPRDYANGVPEPAKIDNAFAAVQAAVFAKAGMMVPFFDYSSLDRQNPSPVNIRMNNNGKVFLCTTTLRFSASFVATPRSSKSFFAATAKGRVLDSAALFLSSRNTPPDHCTPNLLYPRS